MKNGEQGHKLNFPGDEASDTLARKLIANGEKGHELNFPDSDIEVHPERKRTITSKYLGVSYNKKIGMWAAHRNSKIEKSPICNGYYCEEERAAHASDTLARKLMKNGEKDHKLNFPADETDIIYPKRKRTSKYFGISYNKVIGLWTAQRWSKNEKCLISNGCYNDTEKAAHASDTLARKLIANEEKHHKLNFPDDDTELWSEMRASENRSKTECEDRKRKRLENMENTEGAKDYQI